eukprot:COSAG01_NODE_2357_length_7839_cov_6.117571_7_plen_70_part_00
MEEESVIGVRRGRTMQKREEAGGPKRVIQPALRFELRTSILLGWRSNQLSYTGERLAERRSTMVHDLCF